jgi:predicted helicase
MSQVLIQQYLNQLQDLRKVSGTHRESVVREAFKDLLKGWARSHDLIFVPEYEIATPAEDRRYVDGALVHTLRVPFGYWEAKDEKDDLDAEIDYKLRRGYPQDNIIFEDSNRAVLVQEKEEVYRCAVDDVKDLEKLLNLFFEYERTEITEFRKAVEQFKTDLPMVLEALRSMIERAHKREPEFRKAAEDFLKHAQEAINPSLTEADVREMLIQHILTEDVFTAVFPGTPFHRDNNVARELYKLEATFFKGDTKYQALKGMEPYYAAIRSAAAQIGTHHEKQTRIFPIEGTWNNTVIAYTQPGSQKPFMVGAVNHLLDLHFVGAAAGTESLPRYRYENGTSLDNITDWALDQFKKCYQSDQGKKESPITKDAIFHYVYGVLHDPVYREKYAVNLTRESPRIPFYKNFWRWADWGKELMDLHIGYESVTPTRLKRVNVPDEKVRKAGLSPKPALKADKDGGRIIIDSETTLTGIPPEAWDYRLGNRSALEWILDQYKEKKPKDPTIREKFNTYRFADYKEKVIDLLMRVTTVSVKTVAIVTSMKDVHR